jgi:hypothetical protein
MALKVAKLDIWAGMIEDRAGGLAEKIGPMSKAGANFEFVFARRMPEQPGKGLMMVHPVRGSKVMAAAASVGIAKSAEMFGLRVEGPNKAGTGAKMTQALSAAGVSFRGLSASVVGSKFVCFLALDSAADQAKAAAALRKV